MNSEMIFSFGVVADIQYCQAVPAYGRYFQHAAAKLSEALTVFGQHPLAFILDLGDLIDRYAESFDTVLSLYEKAPAPVYHTLGNHDFSVAEDEKRAVPERLGLPQAGYYEFAFGNYRFVVLNGNELSLFATVSGSAEEQAARQMLSRLQAEEAVNAREWNGGISRKQLQWLQDRLQHARQQQQKVIVANHYPVCPPDTHNLWNDGELSDLLVQHTHVVAYFCGHQHRGGYARKEHVHFLNFRGMVETETENAFAIVRVYPDRLEVTGYGRENSRVLAF